MDNIHSSAMKKVCWFVLVVFLFLNACVPAATQVVLPSAIPSFTPQPSEMVTSTPPLTFTPRPATPSAISTETPSPDIAPTLPHMDVHFIYHGDRDKPYVALTFDLCQKPEFPAWFDRGIYDVLTKYDVPATFFMGGDWMRTHVDETLLLASNPKFELGNHSWSHPDLPGLSEEIISNEIIKTQNLLYQLTGRQAKLFSLPSGLYDDLTLSVLAWNGLYTIQWDVET